LSSLAQATAFHGLRRLPPDRLARPWLRFFNVALKSLACTRGKGPQGAEAVVGHMRTLAQEPLTQVSGMPWRSVLNESLMLFFIAKLFFRPRGLLPRHSLQTPEPLPHSGGLPQLPPSPGRVPAAGVPLDQHSVPSLVVVYHFTRSEGGAERLAALFEALVPRPRRDGPRWPPPLGLNSG